MRPARHARAERQPGVVGALARREAPLGRQDDLTADAGRLPGEPAPDDLLRDAAAVDIGGVDQGAPGLDERVELRMRGNPWSRRYEVEAVGVRADSAGLATIERVDALDVAGLELE